ncbi:hypothetical protein Syn7502_03093 [Synechococcus sp. PCC 7502]|nr:hypothetical protein Syn7502_03093 [Synechococcus sp. PCC 7502]
MLNSHNLGISACRFCTHYTPEGRRGGNCSMLAASVSGDWQACSLSAPFFTNNESESKSIQVHTLEHEFMITTTVTSIVHVSGNLIQNRNSPKSY